MPPVCLKNILKNIHPYRNVNTEVRSIPVIIFLYLISMQLHGQRVGLVLSGGGVRGLAHIGVLKALEENNIPVDYITGTSAGALVGSMYATGKTPQEMEASVLHPHFRDWATGVVEEEYSYYFTKKQEDASWVTLKFAYDSLIRTRLPGSITSSAAVDFKLMEDMSPSCAKANYNFDSLLVPFRCVASDIVGRKQVIFSEGDLGQAVRASMAFPLYFSPLIIDKRILFDGGIYNNFPVDIMTRNFSPDIMIGVNAGGDPEVPVEDNVLSQVRNIVVASRDYSMPSATDILISPNINQFGVFEFSRVRDAIDSGYVAAMREMPKIKEIILRRVSVEELKAKRDAFGSKQAPIYIDKITVIGLTGQQAIYVRKTLNPKNDCISIEELKKAFFKLILDDNVKYAFPRLRYNPETNYYDLVMYMKEEKDLRVDFGGDFSSRPINEAFIGLQYNLWGRQSIRIMANSYFGKLYSSGQIKLRLDIPSRFPFYTEPEFTINQYDYFKSSSTFFEDVKPSYLVLYDSYWGLNLGFPVGNKGKLILSAGNAFVKNSYYQTRDFHQADTTDQTNFNSFTTGFNFERSTLDRKQYASAGTFFNVRGRLITGIENTIPGSTSIERDTITNSMRWLQLRIIYDNYFKTFGPFKLGFYADLHFSGQPFFANYTASILSAPQFEPIPQATALFLPQFRAHNFIGAGLKNIIAIKGGLELRLEGYIFQPFQEITERPENGNAMYSNALLKRYFMSSGNLVFHSPVGPISVGVNYYKGRSPEFSFLFHFGYILFNKKAME
ncbi:MAG: patatin-like phospholipase family protein [Bacteroidota bacterium]